MSLHYDAIVLSYRNWLLKTQMTFLASGRIVMGLFGTTVPKTAGMPCYSIW